SPSWAKWLAPASPSSPNPHGWSSVRPRGCPVPRNRPSIADSTASGMRSRPAPSTPTAAPSRISSPAASPVTILQARARPLMVGPRSLRVGGPGHLPRLHHQSVLALVHHLAALVHELEGQKEDPAPRVLRGPLVPQPAPHVDRVPEEHRLPEVPRPPERGDPGEPVGPAAQLQALGDRQAQESVGDPAAVGRALGELLADVDLAPVV